MISNFGRGGERLVMITLRPACQALHLSVILHFPGVRKRLDRFLLQPSIYKYIHINKVGCVYHGDVGLLCLIVCMESVSAAQPSPFNDRALIGNEVQV